MQQSEAAPLARQCHARSDVNYQGYVLSYLKTPSSVEYFIAQVARLDVLLLAKIGGMSLHFHASDLLADISKAKAFNDEID
jgi:hypothetical protein